MKGKKWMWLVAAVVAAGLGWFVLNRGAGNGNSTIPCSTFRGSERSEADQKLVDAVMESPEALDGAGVEPAAPTGQAASLRHLTCTMREYAPGAT